MIQSVLLKRCYDSIKANFYINELNNRGIYAFLQNEHTTGLIPFGDGGYMIHVHIDKLDEAARIIEELEKNETAEVDFTEADQDDIAYEKLKTERKNKTSKRHRLTNIILIAGIILLLVIYILRGQIL